MHTTEIESRVKLARDILVTIPNRNLKLANWYTADHPACGTIACAAGHLAMTAEFNALGLYRDKYLGGIYHKPTQYDTFDPATGFNALSKVFGFLSLAESLFSVAGQSAWDSRIIPSLNYTYTDKSLVIARIDYFLDKQLPVWKIEEARL